MCVVCGCTFHTILQRGGGGGVGSKSDVNFAVIESRN